MKKNKFLAITLVALTILSCSKDDNKSNGEPGGDATISISFVEDTNTRVVGTATNDADKEINDVSIFVFRANNAFDVDRKYLASVTVGDTQDIAVTTAAKTVYVVANIGDEAAHNAMFSTVTSEITLKNLIKDRLGDLYSKDNAAGQTDIRTTDVLMTGRGNVTGFNSFHKATVDVILSFPLSKITLVVKDNRYNITVDPSDVNGNGKVSIVDNKVVLINAGQFIKFFSQDLGLDQAVQTNFYSGAYDAMPFNSYFSNDATSTIWRTGNTNTENTLSTNTQVTHHFYTASNDGNTQATILAIESTKVSWNGTNKVERRVYYPIHFIAEDALTTLEPGMSYKVALTLNGDVGSGAGGGTENPLLPVLDGTISATITVAAWTAAADIDKEFN